MIGHWAFLAGGLALLLVGAAWLIKGAARLALASGITPLVVGLTVVAFGTSSPELAVSVSAALSGASALSVANVVGSNIFNILCILGLSALAAPLTVNRQLIRLDVPVMIGAAVLLYVLAADGRVGTLDGLLLVGLLVAYTVFLTSEARRQRAIVGTGPAPGPAVERSSVPVNLGLVLAGIGGLVLGSHWIVLGAVGLARTFGISEAVIGLTVLAAGTGLPELATSVVAVLKGERDLAIGNIIGSNIFNVLSVLGFSGLATRRGLPIPPEMLASDIPLMLVVSLACLPLFRAGYVLSRGKGAVLFGSYVLFIVWTILRATGSPVLGLYTSLMFDVVFPALIIGVVASLVIALRQEEAGRGKD